MKRWSRVVEIAGGDHGNVITIGMPNIFAFFERHSKPAPRHNAERRRRSNDGP